MIQKIEAGTPLITDVVIYRKNVNLKVVKADGHANDEILCVKGSLARVHSTEKGSYQIWIYDERHARTIIIDIKQAFLSFFKVHQHGMFPHLKH